MLPLRGEDRHCQRCHKPRRRWRVISPPRTHFTASCSTQIPSSALGVRLYGLSSIAEFPGAAHDIITAMDIPDPFGVAETVEDNTSKTKEKTTATSVPSASTGMFSDKSRKRTLKDAQLEALESQAEMSRAEAECFRKVARLADFLTAKLEKHYKHYAC
ncbi:hypothetical protein DPMN_085048 [Dreissena polymorpha]|uniref:Uncharacterized protein n=1 Tax=Dreissena polymorpha TaxID=45954 RepID=A0A9D3YFG4_DREPO|nr:hypothetical protein DPMN_085048 [Dreissena polymorpha]